MSKLVNMEVVDIEDSPKKSLLSESGEDSGFGDADESVILLDDSIMLNISDPEVVIVDDEMFDTIECSVENLIEEQNRYLEERCRIKKCFVEMFNFPVEYEEEDSDALTSEEQTVKRTRGRPSKTVSPLIEKEGNGILDASLLNKSQFEPSHESTPQRSLRKRKLSSNKHSVEDDDSVIVEDAPKKKVMKKDKKTTKLKLAANSELCAYEKIREANIKEREDMLKALGIKEAFDEYKNDVGIVTKSKGGPRKSKVLQSDRRRSSRLEGRDDPDPDYTPQVENDDDRYASEDPADHTHDGLKKQPCKECGNCRTPDCRICIFCRDKPKYGGRNIKKQKCEWKEKCSNPIILCYICKGKRSITCLVCDEKFHEMFQLEEHNENIHQVKMERRRSLRFS